MDKESFALKQLNNPELILDNPMTIGLCNADSLDPLRSITKGILTDFNMWSKSFPPTNLLEFTKLHKFQMKECPSLCKYPSVSKLT